MIHLILARSVQYTSQWNIVKIQSLFFKMTKQCLWRTIFFKVRHHISQQLPLLQCDPASPLSISRVYPSILGSAWPEWLTYMNEILRKCPCAFLRLGQRKQASSHLGSENAPFQISSLRSSVILHQKPKLRGKAT